MARDFIKKHGNDHIYLHEIALMYARNNANVTMKKIAETKGITIDNVRTAIMLAIYHNLISYQDSWYICNKSESNQRTHYSYENSSRKSSARHLYEKYLLIRRYNLINDSTDEFIINAVKTYIRNPQNENVWILMGLSKQEMNDILKKGIILAIISDDDFALMKSISIAKAKTPQAAAAIRSSMEHLESLRNDRKRITDRISLYQDQYSRYDDVSLDPDYPYSKDDLKNSLENAKKDLEQFDYEVIRTLIPPSISKIAQEEKEKEEGKKKKKSAKA